MTLRVPLVSLALLVLSVALPAAALPAGAGSTPNAPGQGADPARDQVLDKARNRATDRTRDKTPDEDPRVAWLRSHAVALATIDPSAPGFDDLAPLKQTLAGVRVVLLGEPTRGDGTALLAKDRLVRFLHEQMGFDVLVLECGFYQCARGWEAARSATGPDGARAAKQALIDAMAPMRLYTESAQFQPLLDYAVAQRGTEQPLAVAGAGPELGTSGKTLFEELRRMLPRLGSSADDIPGFEQAAAIVDALGDGAFTTGKKPLPSAVDQRRFSATLAAIGDRLREPAAAGDGSPETETDELAFYRQALANLEVEARMIWRIGVYRPGHGISPDAVTLDNRQTADNLLWLARQRYPGRKIIVSARTVFLARHLSRLETGDLEAKGRFDRFTTVGDELEDALGDQAYIVGITAFEGHAGTPFQKPYPLLAPTAGSFEDLMARTGLDAAFVDLRGSDRTGRAARQARWLSRPLIARPLSYKELRGSWPRHLDALVFLRTMEPSRRAAPGSP